LLSHLRSSPLLSSLPDKPLHSLPTRRPSHLYPARPDATRQYSAYDHRAGRDDEAARAEAQRRARRDAAERDRKRFIAARGASTVDRKSTRLNSSHVSISYAVFCLKINIQQIL